MHEFIHSNNPWLYALTPLSLLYRSAITVRKYLYQKNIFKQSQIPVPVIVIGNISVGGTGKSALIMWLANALRQRGYRPGIVSRGYGAKTCNFPHAVDTTSCPVDYGDEPVMIARNTECPVVIDPNRVRAANYLLTKFKNVDVILSDDGLQHYALKRDIEIAVVDGLRGFGNGFCLPAGPLREPITRLRTIDFIMQNGSDSKFHYFAPNRTYSFEFKPALLRSVVNSNETLNFADIPPKQIYAIAGIGNPKRFFASLKQLKLKFSSKAFPDHHNFVKTDIDFGKDTFVIMTAKDAVKCHKFADERHWYVEGDIQFNEDFLEHLLLRFSNLRKQPFLAR